MSAILDRLMTALADRYRLERELGAGGMATVYLAQDLRHNRLVALKVLRPELGAILGAERFLKEIQLTANLQHPHILPLHDSGEADGLVYYVMPFVEGESLRDRLHRERQLPVDDAVRIATEVADALQYAHEHGVVHRDIKPENILVHGGHAMVADFGIALAASRSDGGSRMTETGMSLGTPHYMAPEQAMGEKEITAKADVYALGCVLYEMLVGEPPFTGPTAQAIIARVMTEAPRSLTMQRHTVPLHLEAVVRMALEKLPADRFASAAAFASALNNPGGMPLRAGVTDVVPQAAESTAMRRRRHITLAGVGVIAAATGAALWAWLGPKPIKTAPPVVRFGIILPRGAEPVGATGSTIAFSPNGARIVYVGKAGSGQRLYTRGMDQVDPVPIAGSEGGILPFFSADGQWLGFKQGGRLMKVALAGGPVTPLCDATGDTYGATWTQSDTVIFGSDSGLMQVPAAGGKASLLVKADSGERFQWPEILPGDRAVLFSIFAKGSLRLAALARGSGKIKRLTTQGGYPRYVNQGYVVVSDPSGIISAVPFDARGLKATGPALPIVDKISTSENGDLNLGVSRSGQFAYQASPSAGNRVVLVDRSGAIKGAVSDTGFYNTPQLSPDGRRVAVSRYTDINLTTQDIWVLDLAQHTRTRLTFDTTASNPLWSPDGRRIAYGRGFGDTTNVVWLPADGSGSPERLLTSGGRWWPFAFEPGGRRLIYHGLVRGGAKAEIRQLELGGERASGVVLAGAFHNYDPSLSPDGHWMAYISDESGRFEVYVRPYPGPGGRWQVSLDGGAEPRWSANGGEIFYRNAEQMMSATVRTQPAFEVGARTPLFSGPFVQFNTLVTNYDVSRDGRTFLMLQPVQGTEQALDVTLNWFDQMKQR